MSEYPDLRGPDHSEKRVRAGKKGKGMWWSIVIQYRGQSKQEAVAQPEQLLCSYDGSIYGDRQAKKMAKKTGGEYIDTGAPGQPRLVKTPMEPYGDEEMAEVERALRKGQVPPH